MKNKFPFVDYNTSFVYDVCHFAKQKRLPFPLSASKSKKCFNLIHIDLWGLYSISSIHSYKYFFTIIDDYPMCTRIFPLKQKSKVVKNLEFFLFLFKYNLGQQSLQEKVKISIEFYLSVKYHYWQILSVDFTNGYHLSLIIDKFTNGFIDGFNLLKIYLPHHSILMNFSGSHSAHQPKRCGTSLKLHMRQRVM